MSKIDFPKVVYGPTSPQNNIDRMDYYNIGYPDLSPFIKNSLITIINGFKRNDFTAAKLDGKIADYYGHMDAFNKRQAQFIEAARARRSTAAYVLKATVNYGNARVAGQMSFGNYRHDAWAQIAHTGRRQVIGWFDRASIGSSVDEKEFASIALEGGIKIAHDAGLSRVQVQVGTEASEKDPKLIVIEHTADLDALGFREIGETTTTIAGEPYKGIIWSRKV